MLIIDIMFFCFDHSNISDVWKTNKIICRRFSHLNFREKHELMLVFIVCVGVCCCFFNADLVFSLHKQTNVLNMLNFGIMKFRIVDF